MGAADNPRVLEGVRCLVVDADREAAAKQVGMLERGGVAVARICTSVAEAREALRSERWDLVVLELALPDGCGLLVAREIARRDDRPALVVLSDRLHQMNGSEIYDAGAVVATKTRFSGCLVALARAALAAACPPERRAEPKRRQLHTHLLEFAREHRLTPREKDILVLLAAGHAPKTIGGELGISYATVRYHASNMYRKCDGSTQRELLALLVNTQLAE